MLEELQKISAKSPEAEFWLMAMEDITTSRTVRDVTYGFEIVHFALLNHGINSTLFNYIGKDKKVIIKCKVGKVIFEVVNKNA